LRQSQLWEHKGKPHPPASAYLVKLRIIMEAKVIEREEIVVEPGEWVVEAGLKMAG